MEIVFKRRIMNELLTTYLPSSLLLLISYATTFFKPFYFEAAVTVNLTVMLVTTNLFIRSPDKSRYDTFYLIFLFSVMDKLPVTSYVRLVDIWLIFGQLIPFIQVIYIYILSLLEIIFGHCLFLFPHWFCIYAPING